uniref:Uncharacterized protein n=1 Tax=Arundo donax TaxID=35708 RepID=A0A0A8Y1V6_ARUDO
MLCSFCFFFFREACCQILEQQTKLKIQKANVLYYFKDKTFSSFFLSCIELK